MNLYFRESFFLYWVQTLARAAVVAAIMVDQRVWYLCPGWARRQLRARQTHLNKRTIGPQSVLQVRRTNHAAAASFFAATKRGDNGGVKIGAMYRSDGQASLSTVAGLQFFHLQFFHLSRHLQRKR